MALKGYFIQATFEDGTEVSAYAAYDGTWYYFYTDRRFRFTLTSVGAVDIQQYQPIGSNMAWYDIDIITAVSVEQFDPDNSGGGTGPVPEDVYTKEEVNQLIAKAVKEVENQIPDLVAQAVQEAIGGLDDRYVRKTGDTMTGQLKLVYNNATMSISNAGIRLWDTADQNNLGNATIRVNIGPGYVNVFNNAHDYQATVNANNKIMFLARYNSETNAYTYESRMTGTFWMLNDIDNKSQPVYLGYNDNGAFLYIRDPDNSCYTYISNDDMQMKNNNSSRIWIRNAANEGAFIAYDGDGNNTWYQPAQISAWTNGGTSQSLITPGADVISFNKALQVPAGSSFLVSGQCRYGGSFVNCYGHSYSVQFNDTTYGTLSALNTLTFSSNYDVAIYRNAGSGNVRGMLVTSSDILLQIAAGSTWVSDIINSSGATDFLQVRQITFKDSGGNSVGTIVGNPGSISMTSNNLQFTDSNNSTTLSYIMSNLGGGGSGGGDIANVTQINIVDSNGTLIGTISGSTGSGLQIASAGSYPVSIHTGSTYQSRLSLSGGNMTLNTGGQSGQYIWIKDAITNNQSASLGTYASASIMNYEAAIVGNQVLDFCNNIIVLINNILQQQGDQFPMPSALSATKQNSFGLKMSNIQANTQLGASRMNYIG